MRMNSGKVRAGSSGRRTFQASSGMIAVARNQPATQPMMAATPVR